MSDEHPLHRLERAAVEYVNAVRRTKLRDRDAKNLTGRRGERAQELAADARRNHLLHSEELQAAAVAFAAWRSR